jgi:hypothetical protein
MGTAVGRIGMSIDDFCRCTPLEFSAIAEGWSEGEQHRHRAAWERTRMQCTCMLQPYSRHKLKPVDVMQFEWDASTGSATGSATGPASGKGESLTAKEIRERFEKVKKEQGLG